MMRSKSALLPDIAFRRGPLRGLHVNIRGRRTARRKHRHRWALGLSY